MSATTTAAAKELPVLFNGPMVRAIRAGRKTQTRRPVKPQPSGFASFGALPTCDCHPYGFHDGARHYPCPYGKPGDRLWVRETWWRNDGWEPHRERVALFRNYDGATHTQVDVAGMATVMRTDPDDAALKAAGWVKKPSIHMPRWAARLILEITDVRVERLQSISEADAMAEGFGGVAEFGEAWSRLYGLESMYADPWLWVVGFRALEGLE